MSSPKENRNKRKDERFALFFGSALLSLVATLTMVLVSLVAPTRTRGTYLLARYDFKNGTIPLGVTTDASLYEEDGHYSLEMNRIGHQVRLQGFQASQQLIVEISISGMTLEASQILLEDTPVFTLQSYYDEMMRVSLCIDRVMFNETVNITFPVARVNNMVITMSNYASVDEAPGFAYSLLLSEINIYEFMA